MHLDTIELLDSSQAATARAGSALTHPGIIAGLRLALTSSALLRRRARPISPFRLSPGRAGIRRPGELLLLDGHGSIVRRTTTGEISGVAAWSSDGRRLAHAEGRLDQPDLVITDPDLTELLRFRLPGPTVAPLAWSPDGRRIAFTVVSAGASQVFVLDVQPRAVPRPLRIRIWTRWRRAGHRMAP